VIRLPLRTLRTRLFAAVAVTVVTCVGVTFLVGLVLTRRAVEQANLEDLSHQADLLADRERTQLLPLAHLSTLEPFLAKQDEQVRIVNLERQSRVLSDERRASLRKGQPVKGHIGVDGSNYLFAAQNVEGKGFVLLRPAKLRGGEVSPFLKGLLIASLVGAALAGLCSFLLARAISEPVRRVAEAARRLVGVRAPEPVAVGGSAELVQLTVAFNEMADQLHRAREAERTFLLSVSHELKTPLTAIRGYAEGLAEGAVPVDEAAGTIRREAARLDRLVRDLLDLARLNQHEFAVESGPIDLVQVAREAVARYEPDARAAGVELEALGPETAPARGDHDRAVQVVSNLVENALRSTPPGGAIRVRAEPALIAVEDTGVGLPPEDLPRAFERFYLYERNRAARSLGSGLGLAIVKELTEAMGGSVEVSSTLGKGTAFVVRLPAEMFSREPAAPVTAG
jgi:two-component system, OmpR family, sensor kinase